MDILAYVLSLLGLVSMILASLTKGEKMKRILLLVFLGNALVATSYLIDGAGINGAAACYLGALMTIINYFFDSKNKPIPKWLVAVYAVAFVVVNLWVIGGVSTLVDTFGTRAFYPPVISIIACLIFILCIGQENGAKYRFWTIVNMLLWCTYDVVTPAYPGLVTHGIQLLFLAVGMIMHDRKAGKQEEKATTL